MPDDNPDKGFFTVELGLEFTFSAFVIVLLTNIYLHMCIKYGEIVVNHITTQPYKIAFVYITFSIFQCAYLLFEVNINC